MDYQRYSTANMSKWTGGPPMKRPDGALVCSSCGLLFDPGHDRALLAHWKDCGVQDEDEGSARRHLVRVYHLDEDGEVESIERRMERDDGEDDFLDDDVVEDEDAEGEEPTIDLLTCTECLRCGAETVQGFDEAGHAVNDCTACEWGFTSGPGAA